MNTACPSPRSSPTLPALPAALGNLLDRLLPEGHQVRTDGQRVEGCATLQGQTIAVLGTWGAAPIGHQIALGLAASLLDVVEHHPGRPILLLVDTCGQALARAEELLCLNGSLAHLARCVDLAQRQGHPTVSLVTGEAVSGGFLSFGLMAHRAAALASAQVRVMDLKAMARVTKIPHERLQTLAASVPTFAPGAENYLRMGALADIWEQPSPEALAALLAEAAALGTTHVDGRSALGAARGGRLLAATTAQAVLDA
jgi:malonate decarboxylase gamma subunit